jgi:hypothetical protein
MIKFFKKILNSEFLPMSEVRKLKVNVVMLFLFVVTLVTIPFSFFLDYSFLIKFLSLASFAIAYIICYFLIRFNKIFGAIQITMVYSLLLTVFYTQGISSFYAYIFFYITLTIIFFYQEIYSYFIYATVTLTLGVFYTLSYHDGLVTANDVPGSMYLYLGGLIIYYVISFIQIFGNEKFYADMNLEWVKLNNINNNYQEDILYHLEDMRIDMKKSLIYEDLEFQKAAFELSRFIADQIMKEGKDIVNLIDLYIYIHEKGLERILENDEISVAMKKTSNILGRYLLNENSDMFSLLISFYLKIRDTEPYEQNRYNYQIESITDLNDEQLIAFTFVFLYLYDEISETTKWHQLEDRDTLLDNVFANINQEDFFSEQLIAFYLDNKEVFKKRIKKN